MEGPLVDIVLLALLVLFFGIQQRSRPQLYFRFWFAGWLLILGSFLFWEMHFLTPRFRPVWHLGKLYAVYAGGLAFLLSFLVKRRSALTVSLAALSVLAPAYALFAISSAAGSHRVASSLTILLLETAFVHMLYVLTPPAWRYRRLWPGLLAVATAFVMLILCRSAQSQAIDQWMLAQLFLSCALLFAASAKRFSLEWCVGVLGFAGWGLLYPVSLLLARNPQLMHFLIQLWDLPKYGVGFAMTLRIFEGSRHDVMRLADGYKDLYEDFRLLYENHPLPMWIYDASTTRFLAANAASLKTYGYSEAEFREMCVSQLQQVEEPGSTRLLSPGQDSARADNKDRVRHRRKDGTELSVELTERNILFRGTEARFVLGVDVTERERLNDELFYSAQHDALTGLPNRLLLEDRITQALSRATRENKKAVVFTMDADRFKLINDTHGHLVGDECLKEIAIRLKSRVRSVDTIARTGGEEFTAVIGGLNNIEDAEKVAGIFLHLFDTPLALTGLDLKVSISIGAALYPDDATSSDVLRKKSDQALYHAKRFGRNRFAFASTEVCAAFDQAMAVELALREALRVDSFELHYQPIYNSAGGGLHFEALLRMSPACKEVFEPSVFITVAEECGLIIPIGNWVLRQACRDLARWRELGGERISVGINISGKQLLQREFKSCVLDSLREYNLPPSAFELELTETSLIDEPTLVREAMADLANHGIRFAIDDFGTGYSSLARLADLPISLLKIDRSFIAQLDTTRRTYGIVTAIIQMAQTLHVEVVAEGVENEAQMNLLLRRGCDRFQGYYLSKPLPPETLAALLEARSPVIYGHPHFSPTRVAVAKRVRRTAQLPAFAGSEGAA